MYINTYMIEKEKAEEMESETKRIRKSPCIMELFVQVYFVFFIRIAFDITLCMYWIEENSKIRPKLKYIRNLNGTYAKYTVSALRIHTTI